MAARDEAHGIGRCLDALLAQDYPADRLTILVVDEGRITEAGTHAELLARRGHYYELYRMQSTAGTGQQDGWAEN